MVAMKSSLEKIMEVAERHNPSSFYLRTVWTKNGNIGTETRLMKTYDEFVSFLFDKVELYGWRITNYFYDPKGYVMGISDDRRSFIYGDRFTVTISRRLDHDLDGHNE